MSDPELKALLSQLVINNKDQQERFEREKAAQAAALLEVQTKLAEEKAAQAAALVEVQTKLAEERVAADEKFAQLIASIQAPGPITLKPPDPDADAVRAEKVQKINFNLRRSQRLKPYKVSADTDIKLFLKKFEEELKNMKSLVGLAGENLKKLS